MWGWLGVNSGQIQIVIAIFALFLAIVAYNKILHQIAISTEQTKIANNQSEQMLAQNKMAIEQRVFELKSKILEVVIENTKLNYQCLHSLPVLVEDFENLLKDLKARQDPDLEHIEKLLETLKSFKGKIKDNNNGIKFYLDKLLNNNNLTITVL